MELEFVTKEVLVNFQTDIGKVIEKLSEEGFRSMTFEYSDFNMTTIKKIIATKSIKKK